MKRLFFLTFVLALLLVACQGAPSAPATTSAPAQAAAAPTLTAAPATSTIVPGGETLASSNSPGCVVQSPFPTPGPTEQSLFPPVTDKDWTQGSGSATVTLTEYSDFQ